LGNDYVLFDATENGLDGIGLAKLARDVCQRRFSIGADRIIVLLPGDADCDFRMRVFNPDGSETGSCGTAFRCVARFAFEQKGFVKAETQGVRIATFAREVLAKVVCNANGKRIVEARMGEALFKRGEIPVAGAAGDVFLEELIEIDGEELIVSAASVGNPHAVVFCDEVSKVPIASLGPALEGHCAFPEKVNAHFAQVISKGELKVRTWERGTGLTLSCGTGASAVVAIANRLGKLDPPVCVRMPGGALDIDIEDDGEIIMRAEAELAYSGWIDYEA